MVELLPNFKNLTQFGFKATGQIVKAIYAERKMKPDEKFSSMKLTHLNNIGSKTMPNISKGLRCKRWTNASWQFPIQIH